MTTNIKWLVYSREHNLWWRANRCGYTADMALAGRYSEAEAKAIAAEDGKRMNSEPWNLGPTEFAVPDPDSVSSRDLPTATFGVLGCSECGHGEPAELVREYEAASRQQSHQ